MEAAVRLVESGFREFSLDLFGDALFQEQAFTDELTSLIGRSDGRVRVHGRYDPKDLPRLMEAVDWVVVPSTWWENAPLAIDDAFCFGRPVLCSDVGGMAEAVRDGVDGRHVRVGNVAAWVEAIRQAATYPAAWSRLAGGVRRPIMVAQAADQNLAMFEELLRAKRPLALSLPLPKSAARKPASTDTGGVRQRDRRRKRA